MRLLIAALGICTFVGTAHAEMVTIMTWNTEFLWDGLDPEEGRADFPWKGDPKAAGARIAAVAAVISTIDPDIAVLQEIENEETLLRLTAHLDPSYQTLFVQGADTFTGQDIGILSRHTATTLTRFDTRAPEPGTDKTRGVSKNIVAAFRVSQTPLAVVGVHLLSRATDPDRRAPREAQARTLITVLRGLHADGWPLVVLGDFNDYDGIELDVAGNRPITRVLESFREMDPTDPEDDLVNVARLIPRRDRWTAWWDRNADQLMDGTGELAAIDHILVDRRLATRVLAAGIVHSRETLVSDHEPVFVRLDLP